MPLELRENKAIVSLLYATLKLKTTTEIHISKTAYLEKCKYENSCYFTKDWIPGKPN